MFSEKQNHKPRLSQGILEMKFMQSTKMKFLKENEAVEGQTMYSSEITDKMMKCNSNFIIEPSYVSCENLRVGRLSFRGMNPEIERQMELEHEEKLNSSKRREQSTEVSNEEMLKHYHGKQEQQAFSVSETIEKKFYKNKYKKNLKRRNLKDDSSTVIEKNTKFVKPAQNEDI